MTWPQTDFSLCHLIESGFAKDGDFIHLPSQTTLPYHNFVLQFILPLINRTIGANGAEFHNVEELLMALSTIDISSEVISNFWQFIYGRSILVSEKRDADATLNTRSRRAGEVQDIITDPITGNTSIRVGTTTTIGQSSMAAPGPAFWSTFLSIATSSSTQERVKQPFCKLRVPDILAFRSLLPDTATTVAPVGAAVTNRGTHLNSVYDFGIPQGLPGTNGPDGISKRISTQQGVYNAQVDDLMIAYSFYMVLSRLCAIRTGVLYPSLLDNHILSQISRAIYRRTCLLRKAYHDWWYGRNLADSSTIKVDLVVTQVSKLVRFLLYNNLELSDVLLGACLFNYWAVVNTIQNDVVHPNNMLPLIFRDDDKPCSTIKFLMCTTNSKLHARFQSSLISSPVDPSIEFYFDDFCNHVKSQPSNYEIRIAGNNLISIKVHDFVMIQWNYFKRMIDADLAETKSRVVELPSDMDENVLHIIIQTLYYSELTSFDIREQSKWIQSFVGDMELYDLHILIDAHKKVAAALESGDIESVEEILNSDAYARHKYTVPYSIFSTLCTIATNAILNLEKYLRDVSSSVTK